uniref:Uncharacterized protein n=1 Tax=Avena sativa TaxID=4498 RepID=A0ACD5VQT0_AVESA
MKLSLAFTLAVLFFQAIPLFEARPLQLDVDMAHHPRISLLPRTSIAKEAGEALVIDRVEPKQTSGDGEEEVAPGSPADALRRPGARSPPSPQGRNPPHYRQPAGSWGSVPWVSGSHKPSRPPAPTGQNPPHWRGLSPRPVDVFQVFSVLSKMSFY